MQTVRRALRSIVSLVAAACTSTNRVPFAATIHDSLVAAEKNPDGMVSAQQFARGTWVELFVAASYTPSASIRRCFTGDQRIDEHDIGMRDDITLLIFKFPDGSFQSRAVVRGGPDFASAAWGGRYAPNATFRSVPGDSTAGPRLTPVAGKLGHCV